jgi:hypothetical protein
MPIVRDPWCIGKIRRVSNWPEGAERAGQQHVRLCPGISDLNLFSCPKRVIDLQCQKFLALCATSASRSEWSEMLILGHLYSSAV